jgi:diguanylate cyclase (GGDEF)-like protein
MKETVPTVNELNSPAIPRFWQLFLAVDALLIFMLAFVSDPNWYHILQLILIPFNTIALIAGFLIKKHQLFPWVFLVGAVALVATSMVLNTLIFHGIVINPEIPIWIEESGLILTAIFGVSLMLQFEKKYNIEGFTIDFSLLIFSIICLCFLVSPNFLNIYINDLTIEQRVLTIHLGLALVLIFLAVLNLKLAASIHFKEIVLTLVIIFISIHFILDAYNEMYISKAIPWIQRVSQSSYHISGQLAAILIFLEKFNLEYTSENSLKVGTQFLWTASVVALLVIPVGIIYRWKFHLDSIDPFIIAATSIVLSSAVVWRFSVLVRYSKQQGEQLKSLAYTDSLTGIPNYIAYCAHNKNKKNLLVFCIDIEDFKSINDMYSRDFGDQVLISLAKRLQNVPKLVFAARTGSDSFLAVFQVHPSNINSVAENLRNELGIWDRISERRIAVPLTFGASHSLVAIQPEKLARQAELALKSSRAEHTWFSLYQENEETKSLPRHELREILQHAIDTNFLPVHFQPIYNLDNGSLKALELLIRVDSKEHGLLLPGQFLDQAKSYGMLTLLTRTCINMVAKHLPQLPDVTININVPPYMLNNPQTLNEFIGAFDNVNLEPKRFCIEVTEDGDIPTEHLIPSIELLKTHGFKIAMDDFGTGYSSLSRLSVLQVDNVKIDRSLLLAASAGNIDILESAISLVKRMGVTVVVEGIETLEQLSLVKKLGADSVQGFLLSKPTQVKKANQFPMVAAEIIA